MNYTWKVAQTHTQTKPWYSSSDTDLSAKPTPTQPSPFVLCAVEVFHACLSLPSIAVVNTMTKATWVGNDLFDLYFPDVSHPWGKLEQNLKQKLGSKGHGRMLRTGLLSMAHSVFFFLFLFLYHPKLPVQRWHHLQRLDSLTLIINQDNAPREWSIS